MNQAFKNLKLISLQLLTFLAFQVNGQEIRKYTPPVFGTEWSKPSEYPDRIVINFGQDPSRQVNVTWRTNSAVEMAFAEIAIASAAPKFWRTAKTIRAKTELLDASKLKGANVLANYHAVEFTDLEPGTRYGYRVGDGERWS